MSSTIVDRFGSPFTPAKDKGRVEREWYFVDEETGEEVYMVVVRRLKDDEWVRGGCRFPNGVEPYVTWDIWNQIMMAIEMEHNVEVVV